VRSWKWRGGDSLSIVRVFSLAWLLLPIVFFLVFRIEAAGLRVACDTGDCVARERSVDADLQSEMAADHCGATVVLVVIVLNSGGAICESRVSARSAVDG
jgi:hypothetical protein